MRVYVCVCVTDIRLILKSEGTCDLFDQLFVFICDITSYNTKRLSRDLCHAFECANSHIRTHIHRLSLSHTHTHV